MKQYLSLILVFFLLSCGDRDSKEAAEFFERGVYHFKKNELDDARRFFKEALQKQPKLSDAYNNIGLIDEIRGKNEEALEAFNKAISIDSDFQQAIFNKGRVLSNLGQNDSALLAFEAVSQVYKDSANFYIARGFAYMDMSKTSSAIIDFERATTLNSANSKALTNLGYCYIQEQKFELAQQKLLKAIEINPSEAAAHNNLAFLYGITGKQLSKAIYHSEVAIDLDPVNTLYRNNYAYSLLINNELAKAEKELTFLSKSISGNSYYLRNLGLLNYLRRDYTTAQNLFTSAESKDPNTALIYYYLGLNEKALGDLERAKSFFIIGKKLNDGKSDKELLKL